MELDDLLNELQELKTKGVSSSAMVYIDNDGSERRVTVKYIEFDGYSEITIMG